MLYIKLFADYQQKLDGVQWVSECVQRKYNLFFYVFCGA